jgi:probable lipoprotein NlpC
MNRQCAVEVKKFRLFFHVLLLIILGQALGGCITSQKTKVREEKIARLVQEARSYTGTPYKYGGTTRGGMDCSGLLLNSFRVIGFEMPRTSNDQSKMGEKVRLGKVRQGDLVFFATGKKRRQITHVGMVTDVRGIGNVRFIHASTSLGVVETDLHSAYWRKRFITARRIVP